MIHFRRTCSLKLNQLQILHNQKFRQFSFNSLSPRKLTDIINIDKFQSEDDETVKTIWEKFHFDSKSSAGVTVSKLHYEQLHKNFSSSPMFIIPIFKSKDSFMFLFSQFQSNIMLMTFLEEYKLDPVKASPWMSIAFYDDLIESKSLGLTRCDFTPNLTKKEAAIAMLMLLDFYSNEDPYTFIHEFNHTPNKFRYNAYLSYCQENYLKRFLPNKEE